MLTTEKVLAAIRSGDFITRLEGASNRHWEFDDCGYPRYVITDAGVREWERATVEVEGVVVAACGGRHGEGYRVVCEDPVGEIAKTLAERGTKQELLRQVSSGVWADANKRHQLFLFIADSGYVPEYEQGDDESYTTMFLVEQDPAHHILVTPDVVKEWIEVFLDGDSGFLSRFELRYKTFGDDGYEYGDGDTDDYDPEYISIHEFDKLPQP